MSPEATATVCHVEDALRACHVLKQRRKTIRPGIPQFKLESFGALFPPDTIALETDPVAALEDACAVDISAVFFCGQQRQRSAFDQRLITPDDLHELAQTIQSRFQRDETEIVIRNASGDRRCTTDCRTERFRAFTAQADENEVVLLYPDIRTADHYLRTGNAAAYARYCEKIRQQLSIGVTLLERILQSRSALGQWLSAEIPPRLKMSNEEAIRITAHLQLLLTAGYSSLVAITHTQQILENLHPPHQDEELQFPSDAADPGPTELFAVDMIINHAKADFERFQGQIPGRG